MDEQRSCLIFSQNQLTTVLCNVLHRHIYEGVKWYWDFAKKNPHPRDGVIGAFRAKLEMVPTWNQEVIDAEYKRIIHKSKCNYLEKLIRKVFVFNTQILAAADPVERSVRVPVPRGDRFIHRVYITTARALYINFWLMEDRKEKINAVEMAKNLSKTYRLICQCIEDTIREMLPIEEIVSMELEGQYDPFVERNTEMQRVDSLFSAPPSVSEPIVPQFMPSAPSLAPVRHEDIKEQQKEEEKEEDEVSVTSTASSNAVSSMADTVEKIIYLGPESPKLKHSEPEGLKVNTIDSDMSSDAADNETIVPVKVDAPIDSEGVDLPKEDVDFEVEKETPTISSQPRSYYETIMGMLNKSKEQASEIPPPSESNFFDDTKTEAAF